MKDLDEKLSIERIDNGYVVSRVVDCGDIKKNQILYYPSMEEVLKCLFDQWPKEVDDFNRHHNGTSGGILKLSISSRYIESNIEEEVN